MILLFTLAGITGAILVSKGESLYANIMFCFANAGLLSYNFFIKEYEMMFLFSVYFFIAAYGVINLRKVK